MSKFDKEQILRTSGVNVLKCMRCGKCSATCPSYDEMEYHPHQFVYMVEKGEIDIEGRTDSLVYSAGGGTKSGGSFWAKLFK